MIDRDKRRAVLFSLLGGGLVATKALPERCVETAKAVSLAEVGITNFVISSSRISKLPSSVAFVSIKSAEAALGQRVCRIHRKLQIVHPDLGHQMTRPV